LSASSSEQLRSAVRRLIKAFGKLRDGKLPERSASPTPALAPPVTTTSPDNAEPKSTSGDRYDRVVEFASALRGLGVPLSLTCGPLVISALWLFWGTTHFIDPQAGLKQVPPYLFAPAELVALSGAGEILLGLAIWTRWRKQALLGTLALLVMFVPFVAYILVDDAAVAVFAGKGASPTTLGWWRVIVIVHNSIMFMWSYALYKQIDGSEVSSTPSVVAAGARSRKWLSAWLVAGIMLCANIAGLYTVATEPWYGTTPTLWAMGLLAGGALVGFIFGVPRTGADEPGRTRADETSKSGFIGRGYRPNANIEVLSDWLTKIIVGVGLVELHKIGAVVNEFGAALANGLKVRLPTPGHFARPTTDAEALAFSKALIVYFALAGVIQGYLLTRMFLARVFEESEVGQAGSLKSEPKPTDTGLRPE